MCISSVEFDWLLRFLVGWFTLGQFPHQQGAEYLEEREVCNGQCEMESQRHIVGSPIVSTRDQRSANTQIVCVSARLFLCVCAYGEGE